ncbi:hypothetical protein BVC93_20465 [Mycobacterium sp. MS1601]|nr:hypothetical protein BVC93_20465 [Mycobacterium sp. MS1601]
MPTAFRSSVVSQTLWSLRIDNWSQGAISNLHVEIIIEDSEGKEVPHGYRLADKVAMGKQMGEILIPEIASVFEQMQARYSQFVDYIRLNAMTLAENPEQMAELNAQFNSGIPEFAFTPELGAKLQADLNFRIQAQLTDEWDKFLYPNRFLAMAIETTRPDYIPHLYIRYEDSNHYAWERTDTTGPKRISDIESQN